MDDINEIIFSFFFSLFFLGEDITKIINQTM